MGTLLAGLTSLAFDPKRDSMHQIHVRAPFAAP
jgi:hypothetical protein